MKKTISAIMIMIMLVSVASICVNAAEAGESFGDVPMTMGINVDAVKDEDYTKGLLIEIANPDKSDSTSKSWILWNEGYLNIYTEVYDTDMIDPDVELRKASPWGVDSFEVFIDEKNDGHEVIQHRIDSTGYPSYRIRVPSTATNVVDAKLPEEFKDYFEYAAKKITNGYAVEFKMPINGTAGSKLGFQLQINDKRADSAPAINPAAKLSPAAWDSDKYNYITLSSEMITVIEVVESDQPATAEAAPVTTAAAPAPVRAAQTSDMTIIIAISTLLTSGAALIVSKKRK